MDRFARNDELARPKCRKSRLARSGPFNCLLRHAAFSRPSLLSASCTFGRAATRAW
jgi:hypothetical protein